MTLLFAILFVLAGVAAFAFYLQADALKKKDDARRQASDEAGASAQKSSKELEAAKEELSRRKAEAAELREKLNELRSKTHKQRETEKKQKGGALAEAQDALETAQRQLEEERARFDVLARESKGMEEELAKFRENLKKTEEAYKAAQAALSKAQAAPAPAAGAPAPAPVVAIAPPPKTDEQLLARVSSLESQLKEVRRKAAEADEELRKARGASSTAKRQFMVTKSELDLFREKLVWSEKRVVELERLLFDNKIALPEREAAPQPKPPALAPGIVARESANTGGEGVVTAGADYVPEPTSSEQPTAASVPTETTPAPAAEAAPAPEASGPQAVPPLRRPKAAEGQAKAE